MSTYDNLAADVRQELQFAHDEGLLPDQYERAIVALDELVARIDTLTQENERLREERDKLAHGLWGSSAVTITAYKHRAEAAEAALADTRKALGRIETRLDPSRYRNGVLSDAAEAREIARRALAAGEGSGPSEEQA